MRRLEDIIWGDEGFDEDALEAEPTMIHVNCLVICCCTTCDITIPPPCFVSGCK